MLCYSDACERNKAPILNVLREAFADATQVLEIGSGTGQHAVYFGAHLPWLRWQPSEVLTGMPGLQERLAAEAPVNVLPAVELDVCAQPWPVGPVDGVFSANTLHIVSWELVQSFFRGIGEVLRPGGTLCVYGPFRYRNGYTSASNAEFDIWLKQRDPVSGIRDFEAVNALAAARGLELVADHPMPANNQTLVWRRSPQP